jgi:hypothetical protein
MQTRVLILVIAAILVGMYAAHSQAAGTASSPDRRVAKLQRQVTSLQKQVTLLNVRVRSISSALGAGFEGNTCGLALTADLIQGTWGVIDQMAQALQGRTYFGPQTQVNDFRNCADLINPTVPRPTIQVPPTIAPFQPLIQWMHVPL